MVVVLLSTKLKINQSYEIQNFLKMKIFEVYAFDF